MINTSTSVLISPAGYWLQPMPAIPPKTLRLIFKPGTTPTIGNIRTPYNYYHSHEIVTVGKKGTFKRISYNPNMWDWTYNDSNWSQGLWYQFNLLHVLGADTTGVTSMRTFFTGCDSLNSVCMMDTSSVTDMHGMFANCLRLEQLALFDTSNVTNMSRMFEDLGRCYEPSYKFLDVPSFNTSKVTNMSSMFELAWAKSYPMMDTSKVTNMNTMFGASNIVNPPNYDTSSVIYTAAMFAESQIETVPLYDLSKVTNMGNMFNNCHKLKSIPDFDLTNVRYIDSAFASCENCASGQYNMYYKASHKDIPVISHLSTFYECGTNTTTGSAELAQIPSGWKSLQTQ